MQFIKHYQAVTQDERLDKNETELCFENRKTKGLSQLLRSFQPTKHYELRSDLWTDVLVTKSNLWLSSKISIYKKLKINKIKLVIWVQTDKFVTFVSIILCFHCSYTKFGYRVGSNTVGVSKKTMLLSFLKNVTAEVVYPVHRFL